MLQAVRTAAFLRVEMFAGEIAHHLPVAVGGEDVAEALFGDISDMEGLEVLVEQEAAGRDQPIAGQLHDEGWSETAAVAALAFVLDAGPFHHDAEFVIAHGLGGAERRIERVVFGVVDAEITVDIVGTVLVDEVIRPDGLGETGQWQYLVVKFRHCHHLHVDCDGKIVAAFDLHGVTHVLDHLMVIPFLETHDLLVAVDVAGGKVEAQIGQVRQDPFQHFALEPHAVGADADLQAKSGAMLDRPLIERHHGRFAVADQRDALDPDGGGILEEVERYSFGNLAAFTRLHLRIAERAGRIAFAGPSRIDRHRRDLLAAFPGFDPVAPPADLGAVEDQIARRDDVLEQVRHCRGHSLALCSGVIARRNLESSAMMSLNTSIGRMVISRSMRSSASMARPWASAGMPQPNLTTTWNSGKSDIAAFVLVLLGIFHQ